MFDVAIIGGGPAGYNGAIRAAELGLSVALIEKEELGGTCLNRGCIPTKSLLKSAEIIEQIEKASLFGITASFTYSLEKIYERKDFVVEKLRKGIAFLMKKHGITVYYGKASFVDEHTLALCSDGSTINISAKNIIIATGSSPIKLNIEGIEYTLNSDKVLSEPLNADNIVIIGGGVIGVEYACFFSALKKNITIVEAEQRILPSLDKDISTHLAMQLKKKGVKILTNSKVCKILDEGRAVDLDTVGKITTINTDAVILSVGRVANTQGLNLENAGVLYNKRIIVDSELRTNISHIYAVGDVSSAIQLAHLAEAEAITAVEHIAGKPRSICLSSVPSCVYTLTEIACVGNTEAADNTVVGKALMGANGKANIEDSGGFVKTVFDKNTKKLLGAAIMCSRATDMIGELAIALTNGLTAFDIAKTIHPHPTLSESIRISVEDAIKNLQ